MPKPHQIGKGKTTENLIEDVIYNGTDYTFSAKILSTQFLPSEIIAELAAIKQQIEKKDDKSELRQFIYNSRLLISELIKANPKDIDYLQIQQYVMNPNRQDRKKMREDFAKVTVNEERPDILKNFHSLMTVSRRSSHPNIIREMKHAWQSIRRVSRRNQVAKDNEIVISRVDSGPSVKPPPPSTPPPTKPIVIAAPQTTSQTKKVQRGNLISAIRSVLKRTPVTKAKQNHDFVIQRNDPVITRQSSEAPVVPKTQTEASVIPPPLPKYAPAIKLENDPFAELVKTEETYVNTISVLTDANIQQVMRDYQKNAKEYRKKGYASSSELEGFLKSVAKLAVAHTLVLESFKNGDYKDGMEQVQKLQKEYTQCMIDSALKIPPDLRVVGAAKTGFNNSVDSILSQSFQRITRYPMLLKEMSKSKDNHDDVRKELQGLLESAGNLTAAVNRAKARHEDSKMLPPLINLCVQKPTTDTFRKILETLHKSAFDENEKKQFLNPIDFSKFNKNAFVILQQYIQKETDPQMKSFLAHKATAGQLIKILEADMPQDKNSPEAAFLSALRSQIAIQSSVRQSKDSLSNMTILTDVAIDSAKNAYLRKGGTEQGCETMAKQYEGIVNFVQKDVKEKIYSGTLKTNMLASFQQQKETAPEKAENAKKAENKSENTPETLPRKNTF
jgi:hypothetical protein